MIILTPFGTTTGLEVVPLPLSSDVPPIKFEDAWIEVTGGQITLRSGKDAYVVLRKQLGQQVATWIGLYRLAREIGYDRPGSFYGAGAWLIGCTADTRALLDMLRDMADQIQSKAMSGDRFIKRIDQVRSELVAPPQVNAVISSVARVGAGCLPSGGNAFIVATANHLEIIDWAQNAPSASPYCRVIVGNADHAPSTVGQTSLSVYQSLASAIDSAYLRVVTDFNQARALAETQRQEMGRRIADLEDINAQLQNDIRGVNAKFMQERINADHWRKSVNDLQKKLDFSEQKNRTPNLANTIQGDIQWNSGPNLQDRYNAERNKVPQTFPVSSNMGGLKQATVEHPVNQAQRRLATQNISYDDDDADSVGWVTVICCVVAIIILFTAVYGYFRSNKDCLFFAHVCRPGHEKIVPAIPVSAYPSDNAQIPDLNSVNGSINSVRGNVGSGQSIGNPAGVKKP